MAPIRSAFLGLVLILPLSAGDAACNGGLSQAGRRIRNLQLKSWMNSLSQTALPAKAGDILTADLQSQILRTVQDKIKSEQPGDISNRGGVQVVFIQSCLVAVDENQVDITITPWAVAVPLPGRSSTPTNNPQPNMASLRSGLPSSLRALDPELGVAYDRGLDVSTRAAFHMSLGELRDALSHSPDQPRKSDFLVSAEGSRSMKSDNYDTRATLAYEYRSQASAQRLSLQTTLEASRQPQGNSFLYANSIRTGLAYYRKKLGFSVAHRWANNRTVALATTEQAVELRTGTDLRIPYGVARATAFADYASPAQNASYTRIAIRSGFSMEIPIIAARDANGEKLLAAHTLGVDTQISAGKASKRVPTYAQFHGGSDGGRFVFDESLSTQFSKPYLTGPVVRGYGQNQTPTAGSTYWGLNLNLAVPIPKWSRFLIPVEKDEDGVPLAQRIEVVGLRSGENLMASYYENEEHLEPAAAAAKAKADIDSVRPAVKFISRYAKLYGIRPQSLIDVARISSSNDSRMLYSAGMGLQLTLVTARMEVGYVWTLARRTGAPAGNVVFRLSFQNLF